MKRLRFTLLTLVLFITFTVVSAAAQSFPEGKWTLTSYQFDQKIGHPIDKKGVTLNIHADGKLGGGTGCNTYGGSYLLEDGKLRIFDVISTMRACEEPTPQCEGSFFKTLGGATEFSLKDGKLTITDPKTKNFLLFEHVEKSGGSKDKTEDR